MPSRLNKPRPESNLKSDSPRTSRDFPIHQDTEGDASLFGPRIASPSDPSRPENDRSPRSTTSTKSRLGSFLHRRKNSRPKLEPAPPDVVNSLPIPKSGVFKRSKPAVPVSATPTTPSTQIPSRMASIRAVGNSFDEPRDGMTEDDSSSESHVASRSSAFSSSITSNASGLSAMSQQPINSGGGADSDATVRLKPSPPGEKPTTTNPSSLQVPSHPATTTQQKRSGETTNRPSFETTSSFEIPQRESSRTATTTLATIGNGRQPATRAAAGTHADDNSPIIQGLPISSWDSAIGKAAISGKTGRVINKLVSDNESLKRDIKLERLRADEAKQAARLLEDRMERMSSDYEGRLLEASVTKTLLARKERQVETLQAAIEVERQKASSALERERLWKDEMQKVRTEAKHKVDEATAYAAMMEARYNTISSHWHEQGNNVQKALSDVKTEVDALVEERLGDDEKISTLREVCEQQDGNIRDLTRQKEEIFAQFEAYKAEQEEALREIKASAARREEEQERVLAESNDVLDKLKWALRVKENVEWAE